MPTWALRQTADPARPGSRGAAGAGAQLFRPGRHAARRPGDRPNPFYWLVPRWALYPHGGIATAAAVVASQALISGAFSLDSAGGAAGLLPRVTILHTSQHEIGQIYIREVNRTSGSPACSGARLPELQQSGRGLRHRGHRHDDHHDAALLRRGARALELEPWLASVRSAACSWVDLASSGGQPGQDRERRLVPARGRRRRLSC